MVVKRPCSLALATAVAPSAVIALNIGMSEPAGNLISYVNLFGSNPSILALFARISLSNAVERSV